MKDEINFDDDKHDALYFGLISDLAQKYQLRYAKQTEQLLEKKTLKIEFEGADITFRLTPVGCEFSTRNDQYSRSTKSWSRMGWSKAAKRLALPHYFARAEATVLMNQKSEHE